MELFSIACSTCRARLKVVDLAAIGHILACPKCGSMVQVDPPAGWRPPELSGPPGVPTAATVFEGAPTASRPSPVLSAIAAGEAPIADAAVAPTRFPLWTGLSAGALMVATVAVVIIWSARTGNKPQPPAVAQRPEAKSAPVPEVTVEEPAPSGPARLNSRWLPADAERIVSFRWNDTAAQAAVRDLLTPQASTSTAPDKLLSAAGLEPAHVHRLTWAGGPADGWLDGGVTIVEFAAPQADALPPTARGEPLDFKLGEGTCHRPAAAHWPHPWVQADPRTIITGPLANLRQLAERDTTDLQHPGVARLVRAISADHHVTVVMPWGATSQREEPAIRWLDALLSTQADWNLVRDEPLALALAIDFGKQVQAEFALLCTTQATADRTHAALEAVFRAAEPRLTSDAATDDDTVKNLRQLTLTAIKNRQTGVAFPTVWGRMAWGTEPAEWTAAIAALHNASIVAAESQIKIASTPQPASDSPTTAIKPPTDPQPSTLNSQPSAPPVSTPAVATTAETSTYNPQLESRLAGQIPAIEFTNVSLGEVVDLLKDLSNAPISIDLHGLAEVGVAPDERVSGRLSNTTAAQVLDDTLTPLKLGFVIDNNQVLITSTRRQRESLYKLDYPVPDLASDERTRKDLAAVFERFVEPGSWQTAGGKGTTEVTFKGIAVVQNRAVHRQLQQLCEKLRRARGLLTREEAAKLPLDIRAAQAGERLQRPVTASFPQETPLDRVLAHLARSTSSTIVVDSLALTEQGLSSDAPTTLKVAKQPLSEALTLLLEPLGLTWLAVDQDTLQITTQSVAAVPELELHRAGDLLGPKQTAAQLIDRIGQAFAPPQEDPKPAAPVVHFDEPSGYLIVLAPQRDQTQLQSLLESWRMPDESRK